MKVAITGATGYIGQRLIHFALLAGYDLLILSRCPVAEPSVVWQRYDLSDTGPVTLPLDIDIIFHLAIDTRHTRLSEQCELEAAQRLINEACRINATFVFVSSQTARADAPTAYGRTKWHIERMTLNMGGRVIRPGLVYGGRERGLFEVLCSAVRHLPALPIFLPMPMVQPVHVDDLAVALLASVAQAPSSVLRVASPRRIGFTAFLRAIARGRTTRRPIVVPLPAFLVRLIVALLGPSLAEKFGLMRLISLFELPAMDTADDLQRLSLTLRPLSSGITRSGTGRRELIREGRSLLTYILRMPPANMLIRRYVRAIEALRKGRTLYLPNMILNIPALLGLFEDLEDGHNTLWRELTWRLDAALLLAEASPQGAIRFLGTDKPSGLIRSGLYMTKAVLTEISRRTGQLILRPVLVRLIRWEFAE